MKKIFSLMLVVILSFSVMTTVAMANDAIVTIGETYIKDGSVYVPLKLTGIPDDGEGGTGLISIGVGYTWNADAMSFTKAEIAANAALETLTSGTGACSVDSNENTMTEAGEIFTLVFKILDENADSGFAITSVDVMSDMYVEFSMDFDNSVVVALKEKTVNTIDVSDSVAVTTDAAATDCQIGTGIGLTANAGEAVFTKMIWALTSGENKLFSKVIELPGISGEFKVAATFINGSHNEKFDVEVVESVAIDAVNAIFTDGTADYFTDATDAALKAE